MVFVRLSSSRLFNPVCFWRNHPFFGFLSIFFFFNFLGDRSFSSCSYILVFLLLSDSEIKVLEILFVLCLSIVQFLLKLANITEQYLLGTFSFSGNLNLVSWYFLLRHAIFFLGFCSVFLLKGFRLVCLFEKWQHSNFASTRIFFESHPKFSSPHMFQPNCRGND